MKQDRIPEQLKENHDRDSVPAAPRERDPASMRAGLRPEPVASARLLVEFLFFVFCLALSKKVFELAGVSKRLQNLP